MITVLQADREHSREEWEKQALAVAVLQSDVAWLRREVAKHSSRLR
jgi:hypothetical protein